MTHPDDLQAVLGALARASERSDAAGFIERNRAVDALEVHLDAWTHTLRDGGVADRRLAECISQGAALRDRLQRINDSMAQRMREQIAAGRMSARELLTTFQQYAGGFSHDTRDEVKHDDLDVLLAGMLSTDQLVDDDATASDPDMVPYQPTPARLILALIQEIRPTERDVFVDVGSGLGTVPILVALLTSARAVGIEWHAHFCAHAQRCARSLNLSSVSFVRQDARNADYSTGTIFYLFTPFTGTMLRDVLRRLDSEARRRTIRLCAYGPLLREGLREFSSFSIEHARSPDAFMSFYRSSPDGAAVTAP